tara:strand:- start:352 stop:1083 length:732 start_codon:yes stop_codon:yes gene_type:complete
MALSLPLNATELVAGSDTPVVKNEVVDNLPKVDPFAIFAAEFKAYRFGKELGKANISLSKLDNNQYRLDYSSSVSIFFLSDKRKETSYFTVEENKIIPKSYVFKRTGTGSDKHMRIEFDHDKGKILVNDRPSFPLEDQLDNQLYRLDLQAKLALGETQFDYRVINDRGQYREYQMQVLGIETLSLPFGEVQAIKVGIVRENSSRNTFAWFSPALNFQLVRLQQFKDGDEQGDIKLSQYSATQS